MFIYYIVLNGRWYYITNLNTHYGEKLIKLKFTKHLPYKVPHLIWGEE